MVIQRPALPDSGPPPAAAELNSPIGSVRRRLVGRKRTKKLLNKLLGVKVYRLVRWILGIPGEWFAPIYLAYYQSIKT